MALDFPSSPSNGQTYTGPGGVVWTWDGAKWANGVSAASAVTPSDASPAMDGTAAAGTSALYSRGDHVHPTDTSRYAASNPSGYQTAAQVTTALTPYATLAAPVFTGDARAVTPAAGDADTSIATTAFVAATVASPNYANNTGFAINQRAYVSGTALGAGAFGHDRWKGGGSGCTYTFAAPAGPANTITITAGSLYQVVEGASLIGGNYVLSWTGTAQGRVGAGSYAASPVSVAGITAGANTTIEFNTGTLSRVKFEAGSVATPWQALSAPQDIAACQRFFCSAYFNAQQYQVAGLYVGSWVPFPVTMRAVPTSVLFSGVTYTNGSGITGLTPQPSGVFVAWIATAQGSTAATSTYWSATADI